MLWSQGCFCCLVAKSCPTLCDPMDCSPSGSSVHGISQAKMLEGVAISFLRGSSCPRDQTHISCIGSWTLITEPLGKLESGRPACKSWEHHLQRWSWQSLVSPLHLIFLTIREGCWVLHFSAVINLNCELNIQSFSHWACSQIITIYFIIWSHSVKWSFASISWWDQTTYVNGN